MRSAGPLTWANSYAPGVKRPSLRPSCSGKGDWMTRDGSGHLGLSRCLFYSDVFSDHSEAPITISRKFDVEGKSTWLIDGKASTQKKVERLTKSLQIQVVELLLHSHALSYRKATFPSTWPDRESLPVPAPGQGARVLQDEPQRAAGEDCRGRRRT